MIRGKEDYQNNRVFLLALVKAWRGGPGRFYAYTFGAGLMAFIGAPWWAPVIEAIGTWILVKIATLANVVPPQKGPSVSPWLVAAGGFIICIASMRMFYLIQVTATKSEPLPTEGHTNVNIPQGSDLKSGIDCITIPRGMVVTALDIPEHLLNAPLKSGHYDWRSKEDAISGLGSLLNGRKPIRIEVTETPGGYRISGKEMD